MTLDVIFQHLGSVYGNSLPPGVTLDEKASLTVLACLPGVNRDLAQAIISYRQSNGFFPNIAELLKVSGMNAQTLKQFALLVCARSETESSRLTLII